jgi:hypothetical protein
MYGSWFSPCHQTLQIVVRTILVAGSEQREGIFVNEPAGPLGQGLSALP